MGAASRPTPHTQAAFLSSFKGLQKMQKVISVQTYLAMFDNIALFYMGRKTSKRPFKFHCKINIY
jgi:hypothetical protein